MGNRIKFWYCWIFLVVLGVVHLCFAVVNDVYWREE